jgi:hypothetical protein
MTRTQNPSKVSKVWDLESLGAIDKVWQIKVHNIVPNDEVGVNLFDELLPLKEEVTLVLEFQDLRANNVCACVECKHIANERLGFTWIWSGSVTAGHDLP